MRGSENRKEQETGERKQAGRTGKPGRIRIRILPGEKLFQYFMLLFLFAAAFLLPTYGARRQAKEAGIRPETGMTEKVPETAPDPVSGRGRIVIDAGHGGDDPGMIGESGINEKILNLIYAQKLAVLLEENGFEVVMTRTTEEGLYDPGASNKKAQDMQRRCAIIEEADPLLTVSLHQNSYSDPSVKGPQVFYYEHSAEGEKLAAAIQESLNTELSVERPRVQKGNATYYILKRSEGTTVIVECGFLTNPEEEAKLQTEAYQDQVARAVCDGILAYLKETG